MARGGRRTGAGRPVGAQRVVVVEVDARHAQMLVTVTQALGRRDAGQAVALLIERMYAQVRDRAGARDYVEG